MKQYIANLISLSRVVIAFPLVMGVLDKNYRVKYSSIRTFPFLALVALCMYSDKLDGIVARAWGSTPWGGYIDFFSDRICVMLLFYFLFQGRTFFYLATIELLMILWRVTGLWPDGNAGASLIHPYFPTHLGRLSIVVQCIGALLLCASRILEAKGRRVETIDMLGNIIFWSGTLITNLAVIWYPIAMYLK